MDCCKKQKQLYVYDEMLVLMETFLSQTLKKLVEEKQKQPSAFKLALYHSKHKIGQYDSMQLRFNSLLRNNDEKGGKSYIISIA